MAKRLTRAKQKIRIAGIPYRVPSDEELPGRLPTVLATVYLVFNEGYAASTGADAVRVGLVVEAIRLGRLLRELMPDEPSVAGLLGLMLLHDSRRSTRVAADGSPVPLAEQDRAQWDAALVAEGTALVAEGLRRTPDRPDPFVVQGAIAACHAIAPRWTDTDWDALVAWYDVLLTVQDGPAARLGRAAVIAERDGAPAGLIEIDAIEGMDGSAWWQASRAELLFRVGRVDEARSAASRATALGLNTAHATRLLRSRDGEPGGTMTP
jgi:RNA polymerase sigma-70 factor (ECF subfamily)